MEIKLGKKEAKFDKRTIKFSDIVRVPNLPPLPEEWEFSKQYPQFDLKPKMWGNDSLGNCVFVASVAQQRDFEVLEQGQVISIDELQLEEAYMKESGGDNGLYMLDHLKEWRTNGLPIGRKKKVLCLPWGTLKYKIYAFASIDPHKEELMYATMLLGCNIGACMPDSYSDQFWTNHPWDDTSLPPNPQNGHAMKVRGWIKEGLLLWTWGKLQLATWNWCLKYFDEAYGMIDARDSFLGDDSPVDVEKLSELLKEVEAL